MAAGHRHDDTPADEHGHIGHDDTPADEHGHIGHDDTPGDEHGHIGHDHHVITDRLPAGSWVVDPRGSQVNFRARTIFGLLPVNGMFERFKGQMQVADDGSASGALVTSAASIATGIDRRDQHLRSAEFLDTEAYPEITFTIGELTAREQQGMRISGEDQMTLSGGLRIRETTIPLLLPVTVIAHGDHLHIEGKTRIDHHAHGLRWARPGLVGKSVRLEVALTLSAPPAA